MKYYMGTDVDNGKVVIGHELIYFGTHVRIQTKSKDGTSVPCTVNPASLHVIEGSILRVVGLSTEGSLATADPFVK